MSSPSTPSTPATDTPSQRLLALLDDVSRRPEKREFLAALDAERDALFTAFHVAYGDAYYAKLLYLKITNFLAAGYHAACGHAALASGPVTLMVDPANSCQLRCPGCVHSDNERFVAGLSWPNGVLRPEAFDRLLARAGPFATNAVLYNYGEPLLNKQLPSLIRRARGHALTTHLSTNLSIAFDVEEFVRAVPDHVILSIDGITQETYGRFRKRGDLALVLSNVRRIVETRNALGQNRPILVWRFFPFEHNVHEVDDAIRLAESMGVDQMIVGTPFDVSADDPGVRLVECDRRGRYEFTRADDLARSPAQILAGVEHDDAVERRFDEGWLARLGPAELDEPVREPENGCRWLHYNLTVDAVGRVMPCCISPGRTKDLVYTRLDADEDWWNAPRFAASRRALADPRAYAAERRADPDAPAEPYCAVCPRRPPMTYGPPNAWRDLCGLDFEEVGLRLDERAWWHFAEGG